MIMVDRGKVVRFWMCFEDEANIIWDIIKTGVKGKSKAFFLRNLKNGIIIQSEDHRWSCIGGPF